MVTKDYGFTIDDIDWSCPADLEPYAKAHNEEIKEKDMLMWSWWGNYGLSAVAVAVEHVLAGRKARSEYIDKAIIQKAEDMQYEDKCDRKEYKGMTDEQKQKAELNLAVDYFNSLMARF